jgi:hypothetical protein
MFEVNAIGSAYASSGEMIFQPLSFDKEIPEVFFNKPRTYCCPRLCKGLKPAELVQPSKDETHLEQLLVKSKVFE